MTSTGKIYTFRSGPWGTGNTPVTIAPRDEVIAIFGNGGLFGEGGLSRAFDRVAIFRAKHTDELYFGVWGSWRSSRFRAALERHFDRKGVDAKPEVRLTYWAGEQDRPRPRGPRSYRQCGSIDIVRTGSRL